MSFKSGFVALIGHPNVGKSTLLNRFVQQKIAIISPKAQTTRNVIRGIYTDSEAQVVFLDTPGIHNPKNELSTLMNKKARTSYKDVEAVLLISDVTNETPDNYGELVKELIDNKCPLFLVLNKIDLITKGQLLELTAAWDAKYKFNAIIPISALQDENVQTLLNVIKEVLPEGPKYYPDNMITDNLETFIISELIREKVLSHTREEIPHSVAVIIEKMTQNAKNMNIYATIVVERESQKGIIIGQGGKMIRKIGTGARLEIERVLGVPVRLETFVRVENDWRNSARFLKEFGYRE